MNPCPGHSRPTVFVIDDESQVRTFLERLLCSFGYEVETFASAHAFLNRPHFGGCGCILLDIQMPDMNGLELQQKLTEANCFMPIVFITAFPDFSACVQGIRKGAVDFLVKPFDQRALLAAIQNALDRDCEQPCPPYPH